MTLAVVAVAHVAGCALHHQGIHSQPLLDAAADVTQQVAADLQILGAQNRWVAGNIYNRSNHIFLIFKDDQSDVFILGFAYAIAIAI